MRGEVRGDTHPVRFVRGEAVQEDQRLSTSTDEIDDTMAADLDAGGFEAGPMELHPLREAEQKPRKDEVHHQRHDDHERRNDEDQASAHAISRWQRTCVVEVAEVSLPCESAGSSAPARRARPPLPRTPAWRRTAP
jgi:hypothetical protein